MIFGLGLMAWATAGMVLSPQIEKTLGMEATPEEQQELQRKMTVRIERVDKE